MENNKKNKNKSTINQCVIVPINFGINIQIFILIITHFIYYSYLNSIIYFNLIIPNFYFTVYLLSCYFILQDFSNFLFSISSSLNNINLYFLLHFYIKKFFIFISINLTLVFIDLFQISFIFFNQFFIIV